MEVTVIGVAGGTGSGKSTLVRKLLDTFGCNGANGGPAKDAARNGAETKGAGVAMLCHDSYYKSHTELTLEERAHLNYDHPGAFDTAMMVEHLRALKNGVPIDQPVYSFVEHNRTPETVLVKPSRVVIVDGILIFENRELRELMDIKVYVDTDADVRLARRIMRDVRDRGRSMESVIEQYLSTVKPMHEEFVEPSKRWADVIIPEGGFNSVAVAMLIENIRSLIRNASGSGL
ncbi:MAG: uridine kinase [Alistipes sp.]|jgi:uridine kinase|nr:uridine kinase [Alistipes sp.]